MDENFKVVSVNNDRLKEYGICILLCESQDVNMNDLHTFLDSNKIFFKQLYIGFESDGLKNGNFLESIKHCDILDDKGNVILEYRRLYDSVVDYDKSTLNKYLSDENCRTQGKPYYSDKLHLKEGHDNFILKSEIEGEYELYYDKNFLNDYNFNLLDNTYKSEPKLIEITDPIKIIGGSHGILTLTCSTNVNESYDENYNNLVHQLSQLEFESVKTRRTEEIAAIVNQIEEAVKKRQLDLKNVKAIKSQNMEKEQLEQLIKKYADAPDPVAAAKYAMSMSMNGGGGVNKKYLVLMIQKGCHASSKVTLITGFGGTVEENTSHGYTIQEEIIEESGLYGYNRMMGKNIKDNIQQVFGESNTHKFKMQDYRPIKVCLKTYSPTHKLFDLDEDYKWPETTTNDIYIKGELPINNSMVNFKYKNGYQLFPYLNANNEDIEYIGGIVISLNSNSWKYFSDKPISTELVNIPDEDILFTFGCYMGEDEAKIRVSNALNTEKNSIKVQNNIDKNKQLDLYINENKITLHKTHAPWGVREKEISKIIKKECSLVLEKCVKNKKGELEKEIEFKNFKFEMNRLSFMSSGLSFNYMNPEIPDTGHEDSARKDLFLSAGGGNKNKKKSNKQKKTRKSKKKSKKKYKKSIKTRKSTKRKRTKRRRPTKRRR